MEEIRMPKELEKAKIHDDAWVAPGAVVVGKITIHRGASIWYGCVLRSDIEGTEIVVGEDSNIQDGTIVHVDQDLPCRIGARVTAGHRAVLHAATIEDDCLIGMGAVVLSGAKIGRGSVIAAGAVVPEGVEIPPGVVAAGIPAKVRRDVTEADRARMKEGWQVYTRLRDLHRRQGAKTGTKDQFPNSESPKK
jgi:carbonic anhydrase/acetyltransferase-like protein (isoleucine patch superfamily)